MMNPALAIPRVSAFLCLLLTATAVSCAVAQEASSAGQKTRFIDNSLLIAPEYPCTWPTYPFPRFQLSHQRKIGPDSPYHSDTLFIDGNTGTQLDVPPHSVTRPDLNRSSHGSLVEKRVSSTFASYSIKPRRGLALLSRPIMSSGLRPAIDR